MLFRQIKKRALVDVGVAKSIDCWRDIYQTQGHVDPLPFRWCRWRIFCADVVDLIQEIPEPRILSR